MVWNAVIATVLGSAFLSAAFTQVCLIWREKAGGTERARFISLKCAIALERWAYMANAVVNDGSNYIASRRTVGAPHSELPPPPEFPDDPELWRALASDLADRVLSFELSIIESQSGVDFDREFNGSDEDGTEFLNGQCTKRALEALSLASDLRSKYRLKEIHKSRDWPAAIRERAEKAERRRANEAAS